MELSTVIRYLAYSGPPLLARQLINQFPLPLLLLTPSHQHFSVDREEVVPREGNNYAEKVRRVIADREVNRTERKKGKAFS